MGDNADPKNKPPITRNWCHWWAPVDYCSYIWTIPQFYELHYRSGNAVLSPLFESTTNSDYRWYVKLSAPYSDRSIRARIYMTFLDQKLRKKELHVRCKVSVINGNGKETSIKKNKKFGEMNCESSSSPFRYYTEFRDFLHEANILNENLLLLKDDTLTVFVEVHFMSDLSLRDFRFSAFLAGDNDLNDDLKRLLGNKDFSDFTVSINGTTYPVHKSILGARSKVFASMIKKQMKKNKNVVEISDIDQKVFEEVLRYMYTEESPNLDDMASDLLSVANKYDLRHLTYLCEYSLMNQLSVESVVDILILADTFGAGILKDEAIQFIKLNIIAVKKTESWLKIEQSGLLKEVFDAFFP